MKDSAGKLFCTSRREEVELKRSIVQQHISSEKHAIGKGKLANKIVREHDIADILVNYDKEVHSVGETLSNAQRVFRYKVVRTFLKAGVAIAKTDQFPQILEENGYSLTHSSRLSSLIDIIHKEEMKKVKK